MKEDQVEATPMRTTTVKPLPTQSTTSDYAYVIDVLLREGAFDLAKQFIEYIQKKQTLVKEKAEEREDASREPLELI